MLFWLAAAAAAAVLPVHLDREPRPVVAEARATVRIVSGVRLKLGPDEGKQDDSADVPPPRDSTVIADGTARPAKLIEFE